MAGIDEITDVKEPVSSETDGPSVCPLCLKNPSKYTCPRCNTRYCSVECYKSEKHRDCSEMFYKDCFMEGTVKIQIVIILKFEQCVFTIYLGQPKKYLCLLFTNFFRLSR